MMPLSVGPPVFLAHRVVWPEGATVISVSGEIDLELKAVLVRLAEARSRTVRDLADVTFIDSTGLGSSLARATGS
jgi:anti-anti-sigma regulatory factor